jgi:non-lysosomal glucosylceramidase
MARSFTYVGAKTKEISFPLGGIGTGCIGLAGNGRLVDWEIFNKPNKGSSNGFSHFAVRAESGGTVRDCRVLHGDLLPPYSGSFTHSRFNSFGFGPARDYLSGMPHFRTTRFHGEFPFATLAFEDEKFPGTVQLVAFNPFIPLNDRDSGIPAAFFEIEVTNTTSKKMHYTVCLSVRNPFSAAAAINQHQRKGRASLIALRSQSLKEDDPRYGEICVATDADEVSFQEYWYRGSWFDDLSIYWKELGNPGAFANRSYPPVERGGEGYGKDDYCLLAAHVDAKPGEKRRARFVITWSFPNCINYWNPECDPKDPGCRPKPWKNYYTTIFRDSVDSAAYSLENWDRLAGETRAFKDTLFGSTIPAEVIEAISANISIIKTPTVMRLADGTFYGFEGCHPSSGCCEGSCTHVWNYAYALPFLFPQLERTMRDADFRYNMGPDGGMSFRLQLPLARQRSTFRSCADGQFGGVIKAYREWKISGDTEWLKHHWPTIKRNISFAWSASNPDKWDADKDGVLEGRQHHTLDMELFGPNAWLTGFYLSALKAGAEMARHLGDGDVAQELQGLFERGKAWVDENLFNGAYYSQKVDLRDKSILERYAGGDSMVGTTLEAYWDAEHGEIKYQVADGCGIDQVVAQWHANICGLGEIFDPAKTRSALHSIYRYNFKKGVRDHVNPARVFCVNDEAGVVICEYPRSTPAVPLTYSEETMHGFEYQVACHMIQEGQVEEGLEIVRAIRDRYDGEKRNPWNEIECGSNYARSMASYALLPALSGFSFDMVKGHMGFAPVVDRSKGRYFWCLATGWGSFETARCSARLQVRYGTIGLRSFSYGGFPSTMAPKVAVDGSSIAFRREGDCLSFRDEVQVTSSLIVAW